VDDDRFPERVDRRAGCRPPGARTDTLTGDAGEDVLAHLSREYTALPEESE
jgi:hypothetical protein